MDVFQALVLGLLQGLTEFIPVSSSAHLVLFPELFRWPRPGLAFDTILHLGTLLAVLIFFRQDWARLIVAWLMSLRLRSLLDPNARLAWLIGLATVPAAVLGAALEKAIGELFEEPRLVGGFLLVTAAILTLSEIRGNQRRDLREISLVPALLIGLAQAVAIAPGISRSGATIAAALALGFARPAAARFSFLLATPIILGAGALQAVELIRHPASSPSLLALGAGFAVAALSGYLCIALLLRYLRTRPLYPFAAYCAIVGTLAATGLLFPL